MLATPSGMPSPSSFQGQPCSKRTHSALTWPAVPESEAPHPAQVQVERNARISLSEGVDLIPLRMLRYRSSKRASTPACLTAAGCVQLLALLTRGQSPARAPACCASQSQTRGSSRPLFLQGRQTNKGSSSEERSPQVVWCPHWRGVLFETCLLSYCSCLLHCKSSTQARVHATHRYRPSTPGCWRCRAPAAGRNEAGTNSCSAESGTHTELSARDQARGTDANCVDGSTATTPAALALSPSTNFFKLMS